MNDRELLELAARAAGIKARWFQVNKWRQVGGNRMQTGKEDVFGTHHRKPWNPITDDGDALRLAVSTSLHKRLHEILTGPAYRADALSYGEQCATRRAITEAAAEIGKSMGGGE